MAERVGFIGLGIMGKPMARNLMGAGYELVLYNRTLEKAEELAEDGAEVGADPAQVARECGVLFTMLPGPPEVEEIVAGEGGLLEGAAEGLFYLPEDGALHVLRLEREGDGFVLREDPLEGRVEWNVRTFATDRGRNG